MEGTEEWKTHAGSSAIDSARIKGKPISQTISEGAGRAVTQRRIRRSSVPARRKLCRKEVDRHVPASSSSHTFLFVFYCSSRVDVGSDEAEIET